MSNTISPNMNLIIPGVGTEAGPTYAVDINNSLSIIDQHNHSPGSGVQITNAGININSPFSLNNNTLINAAALTLVSQSVTPANGSVYQDSNGFLRYVDLNTGTSIQITNSSGIAGSPGTIADLVSPASATYDGTNTFVWESNVNIAANMDMGSVILRNLSPNSTHGVTLKAPAALASNYNVILPTLPGAQSFLTIDSSGNMASPIATSAGITASNIASGTLTATQISSSANILGSQLSASAGIVGSQLVNGTIGATQIAASAVDFSKQSFMTAGSYTPTITSVVNFGSVTSNGFQYIATNYTGTSYVVNVFGEVNMALPNAATGSFHMTVPVAAVNFSQTYQAAGMGANISNGPCAVVQAVPSNVTVAVSFFSTNTITGKISINFSYLI